ncbi:unnamed protein product [Phytophthora fragariaefolia]|uniref:Unnamed protein product n=1 Tax=Phytophthora fragariaefolia TaxID=1490495 RepID=A0A9W7D9A9_9STRA|nr:unnamed protein product [Phytophthora fragariaefolia]
MSEVFTRFRELLGSKQRATLAYRPQANGQQERSVQTVVRSIRAYIAEADQSDWDDHAERLMFALITSFDATRLDTPFYLVHGWDAQGTLSAMLGPKPSSIPEHPAFEWRRKMQRQYGYAIACAEDLQKKAKRQRSEIQTKKWKELSERLKSEFEKGDSLKVTDSGYRVNPWVHVSRHKPRALFAKRPTVEIEVAEDDDFDAALLPEDSWEPDSERNEYEVEKILDLRWSKRTRTSRRTRKRQPSFCALCGKARFDGVSEKDASDTRPVILLVDKKWAENGRPLPQVVLPCRHPESSGVWTSSFA